MFLEVVVHVFDSGTCRACVCVPTLPRIYIYVYIIYIYIAKNMIKVGGPLSVVKVFTQ